MIRAEHLSKRYGAMRAVDDLSFTVEPGRVTGFLGPNGAGKSTTMRMILGLDRPSSGAATIDGVPFHQLGAPLRSVGALLDPKAVDPRRSAAAHLRWLAASNGVDRRRVEEVLGQVGLADAAGRRVGAFSLGMQQRLGLAAALLGDPANLVFDEPLNGLDPEGIIWLRGLLRSFGREGRAVLVSSHLMREMAVTADHLIVIDSGRLVADAPVAELVEARSERSVRVRAAENGRLGLALIDAGATVVPGDDGALEVHGLDAGDIGRVANDAHIALTELTPIEASLERAFIELTHHVDTSAIPA